jgi:hypothetical protein
MTSDQYIRRRLSRFDRFSAYFFLAPAALFIMFIIGVLSGGMSVEHDGKAAALVFVVLFGISAAMRTRLNFKIDRLRREYEDNYA